MDDRLQQLLLVAFPPETDSELTRGVTEGVILSDDLIQNTPLLKRGGGSDLRGHIRRSGIMFRLRDLCDRGDLPFAADIVPMPHGPGIGWNCALIVSKPMFAELMALISFQTIPKVGRTSGYEILPICFRRKSSIYPRRSSGLPNFTRG